MSVEMELIWGEIVLIILNLELQLIKPFFVEKLSKIVVLYEFDEMLFQLI